MHLLGNVDISSFRFIVCCGLISVEERNETYIDVFLMLMSNSIYTITSICAQLRSVISHIGRSVMLNGLSNTGRFFQYGPSSSLVVLEISAFK